MNVYGMSKPTKSDILSGWYENFIDDAANLSGKSVCDFIIKINFFAKCKYVTYFEFSGTSKIFIKENNNVPLNQNFLSRLSSYVQIDWAFLILTRDKKTWKLSEKDIKEIIIDSDLTIRLADSTSICVYTKNSEIHSYLNQNYNCFISRKVINNNLEIYY